MLPHNIGPNPRIAPRFVVFRGSFIARLMWALRPHLLVDSRVGITPALPMPNLSWSRSTSTPARCTEHALLRDDEADISPSASGVRLRRECRRQPRQRGDTLNRRDVENKKAYVRAVLYS